MCNAQSSPYLAHKNASIDEKFAAQVIREWKQDASLREEFRGDFSVYIAWREHTLDGA